MADKIEIIVEATDRASGVLSGIAGGLGTIGSIAAGGVVAMGLAKIGSGLSELFTGALQAASDWQILSLSLETLTARELAQGELVTKSKQVAVELTKTETAELARLKEAQQDLPLQIEKQQIAVEKLIAKRADLITKYGEDSIEVRDNAAAIELAKEKLDDFQTSVQTGIQRIGELEAKAASTTEEFYRVREGGMAMTEAMELAGPKAQDLLNWLRQLSVRSPFEYRTISDAFRFQMAMGGNTEQAKSLTEAMLDMGAGLGLSNDMFNRLSYNLAQALFQGDLTEANFRQLRMVGLDLGGVLQEELGMGLEDMREQFRAGTLTSEELVNVFTKYVGETLPGAANRMAKTFQGLKSNVADLFFFAGVDLLTPLLEGTGDTMNNLFSRALEFVNSGAIARVGDQIANVAGALIDAGPRSIEFREALSAAIGPTLTTLIMNTFDIIVTEFQIFKDIWDAVSDAFGAGGVSIIDIILRLSTAFRDFMVDVVAPFIRDHKDEITAAVTTILEFIGNVWDFLLPVLTDLWNWLSVNVPIAVAFLADAWRNVLWPALQEVGRWIGEVLIPWLMDVWTWLSTNIPPAVRALADFWTNVLWPAIQTAWSYIQPVLQALWNFLTVTIPDAVQRLRLMWESNWMGIRSIVEGAIENLKDIFDLFRLAWEGDWYGFGEKLREIWDNSWNAAKESLSAFIRDTLDMITNWWNDVKNINWWEIGSNIVRGIVDGITRGIEWLTNAATNASVAVTEIIRGFFGIHSRSTLTFGYGQYIAQGLTEGFTQGMNAFSISTAVPQLMNTVPAFGGVGVPVGGLASQFAGVAPSQPVVFVYQPYVSTASKEEAELILGPVIESYMRKKGVL